MAQLPMHNTGAIPQYENSQTTIPTSNAGTSAYEAAAHRVAILGREEGEAIGGGIASIGKTITTLGEDADQIAGQKEISSGIADLALMQANHNALWTKTLQTTDPNDVGQATSHALQQLNEQGQAFLDRFQTKSGKAWAERALGEYQAHFISQAKADNAIAAGHAVVSNLGTASNAWTKTVLDNPAMLDMSLAQADRDTDALVASTPGLKAESKAHIDDMKTKIKAELFQAAINGTMDKNPEAGAALLNDPRYANLLNLQQRDHWARYGEARTKAAAAEQKAQETETRRIEKDTYNQATSQLVASTINPQTGEVHIPGDFLTRLLELQRLPGSVQEPERVKTLIDWHKVETDREAQGKKFSTDPNVYNDFAGRTFLGADDPRALTEQQVFQARAAGKLNDRDFTYFRESVGIAARNPALSSDMKRADEFVNSYKQSFVRATPFDPGSPAGHQRFGEFQRDFLEDFQRRRAGGEQARQIENDWVNRIPQYQQGLGDIRNNIPNVDKNGNFVPVKPLPPIVPRNPGESAADYAARLMKMQGPPKRDLSGQEAR